MADLSGASAMGLLDRESMDWSMAVLRPLGLWPHQLPPLTRPDQSFSARRGGRRTRRP
ncbi:hypothetical protein [Kutzneria sp. 744]|uniref:hypothetical protein n=1 Tax=Kutzneria sp. (strain 744) TaxID=345341 RepID=UPI0004AEA061|nr:hypothetical protein [Kutzneria sp. 744]